MTMDTESLNSLLARIEAALARIEESARREDALRVRHERLRSSVEGSLRDLETLMTVGEA